MYCPLRIPRYKALSSSLRAIVNTNILHLRRFLWPVVPVILNNCLPVVSSTTRKSSLLRIMSSKSQSRFPESTDATEDIDTINDELLDDVSITYDGGLDHAPATSHGTYLDGINEGLEPLEEYQDGGYHPIHLGDTLGASDRYRVIHKLGHGGFGTVWLCRDMQDPGYVAVKVMAGDVAPETLPDLTLTRWDRSAPGAEYIAIPLDSFSIVGPNGSHQCIVLPVLGPCISPDLWLRLKKDPGPVLREMAYQTALAMNFLHKHGLCHGGRYYPIAPSTTS